MVDVSRGDIVTRGSLSFVVWVHGQGEIQAMPIVNGLVNYRRLSRMQLASAHLTGERVADGGLESLKCSRANYLHREDASFRSDGWDEAREIEEISFEDGRWHAPQPYTDNCFWVQRCKGAA